jgi:hypothetical protein
VFSSPEAAERAFAIALGKLSPTENEDVDLTYARLSHPVAARGAGAEADPRRPAE